MLGQIAIGLALVASAVPASVARDSRGLDRCASADPATEAEGPQAERTPPSDKGVFVEVPTGKVCVDPQSLEGEYSYIRRSTAAGGMAIVEISTTPFMPDLASSGGSQGAIPRPDQPASW